MYEGRKYTAKGIQNNGTRVLFPDKKTVPVNKVYVIYHTGGWMRIT